MWTVGWGKERPSRSIYLLVERIEAGHEGVRLTGNLGNIVCKVLDKNSSSVVSG